VTMENSDMKNKICILIKERDGLTEEK